MKGNTVLAIAVCVACFLLGYLAYVSVTEIVGFVLDNSTACERPLQGCSQDAPTTHYR
ncbi:MAG: hypothetical protein UZ17_ACD001000734 [Acidobacteria bacterium OLB17]|nr:MAG: hypothetical protein UZ17_ACD001000734 [Acidobacteria bacterium OLB17]MCZ2391223.1 hypothetical protein [Acidobacteriota bacterium]